MTARYQGRIVRVYGVRGDRTQVAWRRGIRWAQVSELEVLE